MSDTRRLEHLVEAIKVSVARASGAEASALEYVIVAGHALTEAKALVPGSWMDWVAVNLDIEHTTVTLYMRIARYEFDVRAAGVRSIKQARYFLAHETRATGRVSPTRARAQKRAKAARAALREKEQKRRAQQVGGDVAAAFALARRACQAIEQATVGVENREAKAHLGTAWRRFDTGVQEVNKAIGILHGGATTGTIPR